MATQLQTLPDAGPNAVPGSDVPGPDAVPQALPDRRFRWPKRMSWTEFKVLEALMAGPQSVRLMYLDGQVDIMTISPDHEMIKCLLGALLIFFFVEKDISFTSTGSATLRSEQKGTSKEPDLSYRFGEERRRKAVPDLAIEVIFTSGDASQLEYYRRFEIPEIWFWEDGGLKLFRLQGESYGPIERSEWLPELDLRLVERCLLMTEEKEMMRVLRDAVRAGG